MKPSIPMRLLIRSVDGTWIQTICRDIQELQRIWSAREHPDSDVGILCSSLDNVATRVFESVAKRNAGRMLLSGGIKSCLPPSFETSADPVATVDGIRLFVVLRGSGNSIDDVPIEVGFFRPTDDLEKPMEPQQDWLAVFVRENPDTADNLSRFGIRREDSYLASESELPADLRRRLGVFRAYHLAGANCPDPCLLAKAAPTWLRERELNTLPLPVRAANLFKVEGIRTVNDLSEWSMAKLLRAPNFGRTSLADVLQRLVAALEEGPTAIGNPLNRREAWLGAFLREHPDTAETLAGHFITDEDSYLARESDLRENLRRRLGIFRAHHLAGEKSTDPCILANAAPPWLKQRKMITLPLSTRVNNVVKAKGIRTVDDLASWSVRELLKAPNFGHRSLANILQGLITALEEGPTATAMPSVRLEGWLAEFLRENPDTVETLSGHGIQDESSYRAKESELKPELRGRLGVFRTHHLTGNMCEDPCELARAAPAWLQERKFVSLSLPLRVEKRLLENNILSVKDLAAWRSGDLVKLPLLGRVSLRDVFRSIYDALEKGPFQSADGTETGEAGSLLEQFRQSLAKLSEREREVLIRHLGFERKCETLKQIGDELGLTMERVRQIESSAIKKNRPPNDWRETLKRKMTAIRKDRKQPLTISGMEKADSWFKGISLHRKFCENLVKTVFKGSIRVIEIDGVRYFGFMSLAEWNIMVSSTVQTLNASTGKRWSETAVRDFLEKQLPPEAREFAETLWTRLAPRCHFATLPDGKRVFIGYGDTAAQLVGLILAESDRPLHFTKIFDLAGKIKKGKQRKEHDAQTIQYAAALVGSLFGRGTYGLRKHLHMSDEQAADIRDVAESIILSQPERQWHTSEILSELQRRSTGVGENLDKYKLDIVLASSKRITTLGRMTWVATGKEQNRIDLRREIVAILEEAGGPLDTREIRERLERKRGLNEIFRIQAISPLVRLENGFWGINDRDVPMKRERQLELVDVLVRRLEAKQRGIHESELHEFLKLDGCSARSFASIAAQDSRLKRDKEGYLYLAQWGKPRRHSIKAALLQILNDTGEPPTFRETVERVEAIVGRKCQTHSISYALLALKARSRE